MNLRSPSIRFQRDRMCARRFSMMDANPVYIRSRPQKCMLRWLLFFYIISFSHVRNVDDNGSPCFANAHAPDMLFGSAGGRKAKDLLLSAFTTDLNKDLMLFGLVAVPFGIGDYNKACRPGQEITLDMFTTGTNKPTDAKGLEDMIAFFIYVKPQFFSFAFDSFNRANDLSSRTLSNNDVIDPMFKYAPTFRQLEAFSVKLPGMLAHVEHQLTHAFEEGDLYPIFIDMNKPLASKSYLSSAALGSVSGFGHGVEKATVQTQAWYGEWKQQYESYYKVADASVGLHDHLVTLSYGGWGEFHTVMLLSNKDVSKSRLDKNLVAATEASDFVSLTPDYLKLYFNSIVHHNGEYVYPVGYKTRSLLIYKSQGPKKGPKFSESAYGKYCSMDVVFTELSAPDCTADKCMGDKAVKAIKPDHLVFEEFLYRGGNVQIYNRLMWMASAIYGHMYGRKGDLLVQDASPELLRDIFVRRAGEPLNLVPTKRKALLSFMLTDGEIPRAANTLTSFLVGSIVLASCLIVGLMLLIIVLLSCRQKPLPSYASTVMPSTGSLSP